MEPSLPTSTLSTASMPFAISIDAALGIAFIVVFVLWLIYTIVAVYHWVRYGRHSAVGVPALAVHFIVSAALLLLAASGLTL